MASSQTEQRWTELMKHESFVKATRLLESPSLKALAEKWGTEWFEGRFKFFLILAYLNADKEKREPTEQDVVRAHEKDYQSLHDGDYKTLFSPDEKIEAAYIVASRKSGNSHILFITSKGITYLYDKTSKSIAFENQEIVQSVIEKKQIEKYENYKWNSSSRVIVTNQRILELELGLTQFNYNSILIEKDETLASYLQNRESEIITNQRPWECPKCKSPTKAESEYCSGCGYEFSSGREGAGQFSFAYPKVENVYRPSGIEGKNAMWLMLVFGVPVGIVGGFLLPYIHRFIVTSLNAVEGFTCFGLLGVWVVPMIISGLLGYLIAQAIGRGALVGKGRNTETAQMVGSIVGVVSGIAYGIGRSVTDGAEAYDSTIDIIRVIVYSLTTLVVARSFSGKSIASKPFCETCEQYMKSVVIERIPIKDESVMMDFLQSRAFTKAIEMRSIANQVDMNYSKLMIWHCENCKATGFINAETSQYRIEYTKDGQNGKFETRMIYSASLKRTETESVTKALDNAG